MKCNPAVGSGGTDHLGVDGLVALSVLQFLFDVGRQGHPSQLFQHLQKDAFIEKLHQPVPVRQHFLNLRLQLPVPKVDTGTGAELLARPHQALPQVVPSVGEQQHLCGTAGVSVSDEASGEHTGVVQHQTVPWTEELGQVVKVVMADGAGGLIQGQQPRAVPLLQRSLGDELRRQVVIKIFCLHNIDNPSFVLAFKLLL